MGWFFADRKARPGGDPWLPLKMGLLVAGAGFAVLGLALERDWPINVAIAILALGVLLRFVPRRGEPPGD